MLADRELTDRLGRDAAANLAAFQALNDRPKRYRGLPASAELTHHFDQGAWDELPEANRWTPTGAPAAGYGFSLACLPHQSARGYRWPLLRAVQNWISHRLLKT